MQEAWDTVQRPDWLIWIAIRTGVLSDRDLRLFAVFCARQVQHLLTDERSQKAIEVAERYANGQATSEELSKAHDAADAADAARAYAADAAYAAAAAAAAAAADAASYAADAAADAAYAAAAHKIRHAQMAYLRNLKPNFE